MSILSEILSTGHVDKELLDALDDAQKQLLFCQMRAEQVRKWQANEERLEREGAPKKTSKKGIKWLTGADGEVWVWVMGDHPLDKSIEEILEEEARQEAHSRALRELSDSADVPVPTLISDPKEPEEALKAQLGQMRVGITDVMQDDSESSFDPTHPLLFKPVEKEYTSNGNGVKMRAPREQASEHKPEDVQKRESEIFQSIQEKRERIRREAEAESERQRLEWEQQNQRAREAEEAMRKMAQKAREQHRQLIRTSTSILPALNDTKATSLREAIKNLPRPPKPKSRSAIVDWFRRDEWPRGTGQDPKTKMPAPWFHECRCCRRRNHAQHRHYLRQLKEVIYTVSYVVGDGTFKHFLVERIPEGYQFLGTNQVVHDQLFDLVSYHETAPITARGGEVLKWSVGQMFRPPDYHDIVPELAIPDMNRILGRF
ncbi:unnamed protein product [Haemonchus placei]|uniref:SH2 domain-containing protein n=1 Tax=Haemonchus placei TaxID=6290 RepID=A0A158QLD8_HAEPC|nr:unnamed protein product [Haemonchus placei]